MLPTIFHMSTFPRPTAKDQKCNFLRIHEPQQLPLQHGPFKLQRRGPIRTRVSGRKPDCRRRAETVPRVPVTAAHVRPRVRPVPLTNSQKEVCAQVKAFETEVAGNVLGGSEYARSDAGKGQGQGGAEVLRPPLHQEGG